MPSSYTFTSPSPPISVVVKPGVNTGSFNDSAEEIFRKHFNPGIQSYETGWNALIGGITAGDEINFNNARLAIDQLWIHSASGIYLDRRGADVGVVRPESVGIGDVDFRKLIIKTTTKKVVTQSILEALEVFYGTNSTRANLTSIDGPFVLTSDWTLLVSIDGGETITIPLVSADFTSIGAATATEVAAVITRWLKTNDSQGYALAVINPETALDAVKIYSGALGLSSSVQVQGGRVQNILQFPTLLTRGVVTEDWAVSLPTPGTVRFTLSTGAATTTDLNLVFVGDYVNIFGANFNAANRGTFTITNVNVGSLAGGIPIQYFDVALNGGVAQGAVDQLTTSDVIFFRPTKTTVNDNGARAVIVAQDSPGIINVQLPATTIAVNRGVLSGAYANLNTALDITSVIRQALASPVPGSNLVTTSASHLLAVGDQVFLDGVIPAAPVFSSSIWAVPKAAISAGNGTSTTNASLNSTATTLADPPTGGGVLAPSAVLTVAGLVFSCGGQAFTTGTPGAISNASHRLEMLASSAATQADGSVRYTYTWIPTANMTNATIYHGIASLTDPIQGGGVLISGGILVANAISDSYVYNSVANTWGPVFAMVSTRRHHSLVTLDDGRVLAMGGEDSAAATLATAELFTPQVASPYGSWTATGSMITPRYGFGAVKLTNGNVLVCGGWTGTANTEKAEIYNVSTGVWSATGSMGYARIGCKAVLLPNNQVFVWGGTGQIPHGGPTDQTYYGEIYDGSTGRWYPLPANPRRYLFGGTQQDQIAYMPTLNQVMVVGRGLARIDIFDIANRSWVTSTAVMDADVNDGTISNALTALADIPVVISTAGANLAITGTLGATAIVQASNQQASGGLNDRVHRVATVPSGTTFTVYTPDFNTYLSGSGADAEVTTLEQLASDVDEPGPYIYSPDEGFSITGTNTLLATTPISAGTQYRRITVTGGGATPFPDEEGWLVFGFGTAQEFGPVKYVGRENADTLILDYGTQFPQDLAIGTGINLLQDKGPFVPESPEDVGSFYVTDSSSGRVAASNTVNSLVAAGIDLNVDIVHPGDVGLGAAGNPTTGNKLSDIVEVFAGISIDEEISIAREEE